MNSVHDDVWVNSNKSYTDRNDLINLNGKVHKAPKCKLSKKVGTHTNLLWFE